MHLSHVAVPGNVEEALKTAAHRVERGQLRIAGQQHWYMEPQTAVAAPDEGGGVHVHCSAQGTDYVQTLVSQVRQQHADSGLSCTPPAACCVVVHHGRDSQPTAQQYSRTLAGRAHGGFTHC